jgi:DNA-binding NarL/FixJ family response regulator
MHRRHMFTKLGIDSRVELTRLVLEDAGQSIGGSGKEAASR